MQIQFDSDKLAAYNLTPVELYNLISISSKNLPLGTVQTGNKNIIARFMGELNYIDEYKNMVIQSNGNTLKLSDVADIVLTTEDFSDKGFLSGKEAIPVAIEKSADGSTIELNKAATKAIESLKSVMPPGTEYKVLMDSSEDIESSISSVSSGAVQGLVLATIVLLSFLKKYKSNIPSFGSFTSCNNLYVCLFSTKWNFS